MLEPVRLWQFLGMLGSDVPFFASLCGNDFVDHDEMKPWLNLLKRGAKQSDSFFHLVMGYIRSCQQKGMDMLEAAKVVVPEKLHAHLEYSVLHFYQGTFNETESTLLACGELISGPMLARFRAGELPGAMMMASNRGFFALPPLVEEARSSSSWLLSRPLRAAAAKLLPMAVKERLRKSHSTQVEAGD